jgi:4-hydroxysphinganine ceramide fatty acyl 2-hydroxylase
MPKNFVSNKDESVPMFTNPFLDFLSRVHFTIPLVIYIPVILIFLYYSVFIYHLSPWVILPLIVFGLVVWTLTEYTLHRFLFHWVPPGKLGKQMNYIFHKVHHDYPRDTMRLVMVPAISMPLGLGFYFLFRWILGEEHVAPFFVGLVTGYLFYDMTHYALHHANIKSGFWLELKHHHMTHHYTDEDNGFGVSSKFWDMVFRTTFKRRPPGNIVVGQKQETNEPVEHS